MRTLAFLLLCCLTTQAQTVTVDPNTSFQTIQAWEATLQGGQTGFSDWNLYKADLADQASADGLCRGRLEFHAFNENTTTSSTTTSVNDNADPFVINDAGFQWTYPANGNGTVGIDEQAELANLMKTRAAAKGETFLINWCFVDFGSFPFEQSSDPEEYAECAEATWLHLQATQTWVPDYVEIILEPDNANAEWTASLIASCIIATQSRLAGHGWHPGFIVPATTSCPNALTYYDNIKAANSNVTQYIVELAYHRYTGCSAGQYVSMRDAAQADGKRIAMLEHLQATYIELHEDLSYNAEAWQLLGFGGFNTTDNGNSYYVLDHTAHVVTKGSSTKLLRQYFKWIRPGAVRKGTSTDNANFDGLAFRNKGGNYTTVVKCTASGSFSIAGLPAGTYHIVYTTGSAYNQTAADQTITAGQSISTSIPAIGVLTVFANAPAGGAQSGLSGTVKLSGAAKVN